MIACQKTTVFLVIIVLLGFFFLYTEKESFDTPPINPPRELSDTVEGYPPQHPFAHPRPGYHGYPPRFMHWGWRREPIERVYITEQVPTETKSDVPLVLGAFLLSFAALLAFRL